MFSHKLQDILRVILRLSDVVMHLGRAGDMLSRNGPKFHVAFSDMTDTVLTTLNLRDLLDEVLAACTGVSRFRPTMFRFTLVNGWSNIHGEKGKRGCHPPLLLYTNQSFHTF